MLVAICRWYAELLAVVVVICGVEAVEYWINGVGVDLPAQCTGNELFPQLEALLVPVDNKLFPQLEVLPEPVDNELFPQLEVPPEPVGNELFPQLDVLLFPVNTEL